MAITVQCRRGSGDRPLDAVVDSLIITRADAIGRGRAEINKAWKIVYPYTIDMPYPDGGYLLEVGKCIKLTCPEIGLVNTILYIAGVSIRKGRITLTVEQYGDFETVSTSALPSQEYWELESGGYWELA